MFEYSNNWVVLNGKSDGKNSFEVRIKFKTSPRTQRWPIIQNYSQLTCSEKGELLFPIPVER